MQDKTKNGRNWSRIGRGGIAVSLLVCALAGCATNRGMQATEAQIVRSSDALILPPPGGPGIVTVISTTYPNAIKQDISLATEARSAGENKISIIRFTGKSGDGSDSELVDIPFTQVNLTEEALAAWPDSGMAVSPYFVQNAYGPFGYAIARPPNGDACLYAWQRIEPTLKPSGAIDRFPISIRVQVCRRGVTEEALLDIMYRLRLNFEVFPASRAPAAIGLIANPIKPVGATGFAEVIPVSTPVVERAATPAPAPVRTIPVVQAVTPAIVPPAGAPIVPAPTGTGGSSGTTVPRPPTAPTVTVPSPLSGGS